MFSLLSGNKISSLISTSFLKSSIVYTISGALPLASGFVLLPVYTNYLSPEHYGLLALAIGASVLFQAFFSFSLESVLYLHHHRLKTDPGRQAKFYGSVITAVFLLAAALFLILVLGSDLFFEFLFKGSKDEVVLLGFAAAASGFFTAVSRLFYHLLILHEKPWLHLALNGFGFVLTLSLSLLGVHFIPDSVWGAMGGRLIAFFLVFLICTFLYIRRYPPCWDSKWIKTIIIDCAPVFVYMMILSVTANADVFILNRYLSKTDVAFFDLSMKLSIAVDFIMNSMWSAALPQITAALEESEDRRSTPIFNSYFNLLTLVLILVSIGSLLIFPPIVELLVTNKSYHEAVQWLPLSIATYSLRVINSYFLVSLFYFKKNHRLVYLYLILLLIKFLLSPYMSSYWGITGLYASVFMTRIVEVILLYLARRDVFTYTPNYFKLYFLPALLLVANIVFYYLFDIHFGNWMLICCEFLVIGLMLFVFRNEMKSWAVKLRRGLSV